VPDADVTSALSRSFLAGLPSDLVECVCGGAMLTREPANRIVYRPDYQPRVGLVVRGLLRAYVSSTEGRQVAVWYVHSGELYGIKALFEEPGRRATQTPTLQALTDCTLLELDPEELIALAQADGRIGWGLAAELARRLARTSEELAWASFGTVRQRVARHILVLANATEQESRPVAAVSQQTLADSLGTAREVVARALGQLRSSGLVETSPEGIVLRDPASLRSEADEQPG
jgi:CRP/FNR family transcriptional regulator